jgi:hypothetical protein
MDSGENRQKRTSAKLSTSKTNVPITMMGIQIK